MEVFPEIRLWHPLETVKRVGHFLLDHIQHEGISDHRDTTPREVQMILPYDSEGNWHNPDPVPDIAGRDL